MFNSFFILERITIIRVKELDVVDQLAGADPLLAEAAFHFGDVEHGVEEVHC